MRALFVLFFLLLVVPVVASASDVTDDTPPKTATSAEEDESSKITERETGRDVGFDLYDFFLPHFPSAFLLDKGIFGLERDLHVFRRTSPRYDITYNEDDVVMTVEVPGYESDEIEVEVKSGGRVLRVSAQKESHDEEHAFSSQFHQSFTLDPGVETDKLKANLSNGILTVTAPRHKALPYNRNIPITHLDQKKLDEMVNDNDEKQDDFSITEEEM